MKKILMTLSMILVMSVGLFSQTTKITFQDLKNAATEINANMCPMMIDKETRFDECSAIEKGSELIFQYNYTMVNYTYEQVQDRLQAIKETQEKALIKGVRENNSLSDLRDNGITFKYVYYDKNHIFFFSINITKEKYNY